MSNEKMGLQGPWIIGLGLTRGGRKSDFYFLWYDACDLLERDTLGVDSMGNVLLSTSQNGARQMSRQCNVRLRKYGLPKRRIEHVLELGELIWIFESKRFGNLKWEVDVNLLSDLFVTLGYSQDSWQLKCLRELATRVFEEGTATYLENRPKDANRVVAALRESIVLFLTRNRVVWATQNDFAP